MSLLRLSCDRSTVYAPKSDGTLVDTPFDPRKLVGLLQSLVERDDRPDLARPTDPLGVYLNRSVADAAARLADDQPVVVMAHGFLFDPYHVITADPKDTDNAHGRLYHFRDSGEDAEIRHHTSSWPLQLEFRESDVSGTSGLAVAFAWHSKPGLAKALLERFQNFYSRAYDYGTETAWVFANVLILLARHQSLRGRPIDIFCHSLGSHLVVRALALLCKHGFTSTLARLGRVVILGGAEYVVEAQLMYRRLLACPLRDDQGPVFYNIGCRENDVLDKLAENFGPRTFGNTNVVGHNGLAFTSDDGRKAATRWLDLQIDNAELMEWFTNRDGLDISGDQPGNIWDHWYYYTHRGNMRLYNAILRDRERFSIPQLRTEQVPEGIKAGWFGD